MDYAESGAEQPAGVVDGPEDPVVADREEDAVGEVHEVAEHARAPAPVGERRAEQQRDVHPRPAELLREPQAAGEDDRADGAAGEGAPERHAALRSASTSAIETAALISARCVSACGKLPRNAPLAGSTSSA